MIITIFWICVFLFLMYIADGFNKEYSKDRFRNIFMVLVFSMFLSFLLHVIYFSYSARNNINILSVENIKELDFLQLEYNNMVRFIGDNNITSRVQADEIIIQNVDKPKFIYKKYKIKGNYLFFDGSYDKHVLIINKNDLLK